MPKITRRRFAASSAALTAAGLIARPSQANAQKPGDNMSYGLVTYQWARDWDLPTLIANCEKTGVRGVELRTTHKHGVEINLNKRQRADVAKRFAGGNVTLVGIGSNERFDNPDPQVVRKAIDASKAFIRLSHDVGGTGVKVKPDRFHPGVERQKTIAQSGAALNELGEYAIGFGQQVRLEIHGQCAEPTTIKAIMDVADNSSVAVCWNSNPQDLQGKGLEHNFGLVRKRFGETLHVRPLNDPKYPYRKLMELLVKSDYQGWVMLESGSVPKDPVAQLAAEQKLFDQIKAEIQAKL